MIFIIGLITKYLLPVMVSSWRKNFFPKESVGARYNSKKFGNHLEMFQLLLNLYRMNKNVIEPVDEASAPRRSKRSRQLLIRYGHDVLLLYSDELKTYAEAMVDLDSESWNEARDPK